MTQQQQQTKPTTEAKPSDTPILDKILSEGVTYKPFLKTEEVRLTGREVYEAFAMPTKSGKWPTHAQVANFMKTCESSSLDPWGKDAFLIGYDTTNGPVFNTIVAIQSLLKRAEVNPAYDGIESGVIFRPITAKDAKGIATEFGPVEERQGDFIDEDEILLGGWAKVYRKDRKIPAYARVHLNVYTTGQSRWKDDPAGMICKVARTAGLRVSFPNTMGGLHIAAEFDKNQMDDEKPPVEEPKRKSDKTKAIEEQDFTAAKAAQAAEVVPDPEPTDERQALETALAENLDADCVTPEKPNANHPNRGIAESKTEKMLAGIAKCKNHEQLKAVQAKCKPVLDSMKKDGFTDLLATVAQAFKDCEDLIEMDLA